MGAKKFASAVFAGALLAAGAVHAEKGKQMSEEATKAQATVEGMTAALESGDIDGVMSAYVDGAVIMFEPGEPVADANIARAIFTEMAAVKPDVSYPAGHELYVSGDTAVHIAPWEMTGTAPDGTKVEQGGLSVAVLRLQPDGEWKMAIDNPYAARLLEK